MRHQEFPPSKYTLYTYVQKKKWVLTVEKSNLSILLKRETQNKNKEKKSEWVEERRQVIKKWPL